MIDPALVVNCDEPVMQSFLRVCKTILDGGRTKPTLAPLSEALARQVSAYREAVGEEGDVVVVFVTNEKVVCLVTPRDGRNLFLRRFDALTLAGADGGVH